MWALDSSTLILITIAALQLGLQGIFGMDDTGWLFGTHAFWVYGIIGLSGIWQFSRQSFV
jgi:uncharacterized membrane protein YuzA (DUF378 family)